MRALLLVAWIGGLWIGAPWIWRIFVLARRNIAAWRLVDWRSRIIGARPLIVRLSSLDSLHPPILVSADCVSELVGFSSLVVSLYLTFGFVLCGLDLVGLPLVEF